MRSRAVLAAEGGKEREEELIFPRECLDTGKNPTLRNRQPLGEHRVTCTRIRAHMHACVCMRVSCPRLVTSRFAFTLDTNVDTNVVKIVSFRHQVL